jgi:hypothetical protein
MGKTRSLWRYYVAGAAISVAAVSITTGFFTDLHYETSWPRKPEPERGIVRPMAGKGYTYYISAEESAGQVLLFGIGMVAIFVVVVTMPRDIFKLPNISVGQSRLAALGKAQAATKRAVRDLLTSNPSIWIFSLIVLMIYLAIIYFVGPLIRRLAASYGLGF